MNSLFILVAAAAGGFTLSYWLRIPVIPLLVLLGFIFSRIAPPGDPESLQNLMALGLAFLVYSAGIELNPKRFTGMLRAVLWTASIQFIVLALAGFVLGVALGFDPIPTLYLGFALATSSTFVVIRQLQKQVGSLRAYGRLAIGVLLVQDLAIIVVIVVLTSLPGGISAVVGGLSSVGLIGGLAFAGQRWIFPWMLERTRLEEEMQLLVLLAVLFLFAGLADALGLPFVVGAFFAGFSLSSFPVNGVARSLLAPLSSFFLAIFFTALGASLELPGPQLMLKSLAFILLVLTLTPFLVATVAEWQGELSSRNAITSGLLLAQTSEFSFVLGLYALHLSRIPSDVMTVISMVAVVTMTITPLMASDGMARRLLNYHPSRRRMATTHEWRDHVLVLGFGTGGMWVIRPLLRAGHRVAVVDHDRIVIDHLEKTGIPCIRGDASDEKVLSRAGANEARLILISMPNVQEIVRILQSIRNPGAPIIARVFEESDVPLVEKYGAIAVLNSHAAADTFMAWYEKVMKKEP